MNQRKNNKKFSLTELFEKRRKTIEYRRFRKQLYRELEHYSVKGI